MFSSFEEERIPGSLRNKEEKGSMNIVLWIVQALLALAFLAGGASKTFLPLARVKQMFPWANHVSPVLVRVIGVCEILGGIGLILPGVTRTLVWLTIAAAGGLALIMLLAAGFHAQRREFSVIGINGILFLIALFILLGRWLWAPL
jgi:putative oxidoreductase